MTYTSDGYIQWGKAQSPLPTGTGNPVVEDADPVIAFLTSFASAVITHHAGDRWAEAANNVGLHGLPPVASSVAGVDPFPYLTQMGLKFPLLSVYRVEASNEGLTIATDVERASIDLLYILPALDFRQAMSLANFLSLLARAVKSELTAKRSLYGENGIQDVKWNRTSFGLAPKDEKTGTLNMPFMLISLTVSESKVFVPDPSMVYPLESVATDIDLFAEQSETDLNDVEVRFP